MATLCDHGWRGWVETNGALRRNTLAAQVPPRNLLYLTPINGEVRLQQRPPRGFGPRFHYKPEVGLQELLLVKRGPPCSASGRETTTTTTRCGRAVTAVWGTWGIIDEAKLRGIDNTPGLSASLPSP